LAGRTLPPEPITAQCRVRIALPGGAPALDPTNDAAAALTVGTAVVNTAGGLGGPRGATRAHEKLIHFPDPYADRTALAGLRHWLWRAGGGPTAEGGQP
jgi:S-DNA-T family DNA segregation ATPase FtsK/SpoIIIE